MTHPTGITHDSAVGIVGPNEIKQPMNIMDESNFINSSDVGSSIPNNYQKTNTDNSMNVAKNLSVLNAVDLNLTGHSQWQNQNFFDRPNYSQVDFNDKRLSNKPFSNKTS